MWQTDGENDSFVSDFKGNLISAKDEITLKKYFYNETTKIHWNEPAEIDFDLFFKLLDNIKPYKKVRKDICIIIINGWNFIDDIINTFNLKKEIKYINSNNLNKIYEKFFYGLNIQAMTPKNKKYLPKFTNNEIYEFKEKIKKTWDYLITTGILKNMGMTSVPIG